MCSSFHPGWLRKIWGMKYDPLRSHGWYSNKPGLKGWSTPVAWIPHSGLLPPGKCFWIAGPWPFLKASSKWQKKTKFDPKRKQKGSSPSNKQAIFRSFRMRIPEKNSQPKHAGILRWNLAPPSLNDWYFTDFGRWNKFMSLDPVERLQKSISRAMKNAWEFLNNILDLDFPSFQVCEKNWCRFNSTNKKTYLFLGRIFFYNI